MAELNLKMIKIFFTVVIAMLILAMTSGMDILRDKKFSGWEKTKMEANFWRYKSASAAAKSAAPENLSDAKSVPVLMYHGVITDPKWKGDSTNISLSGFLDQMLRLKKAGYQTITLVDFNDFMKNGKKVPAKSFLLTFDDGRRDSYFPVDPILRALGYNAVMFAITGKSVNSGNQTGDFYLAKEELKEMQNSGRWEIESHGDFDHDWENISEERDKGHFLSNRLWLGAPKNRLETEQEAQKRILGDLMSAKNKLEKNFGKRVIGFAYPFNDFGQEQQNFPGVDRYIQDNIGKIYPLTFRQVDNDDPAANYPDPNEIFVKRLDINSTVSTKMLLSMLGQNRDKSLPYQDTFKNDRGWVSRWGRKVLLEKLTLSDEGSTKSGNLTVLLGGQSWKDYDFRADIQVKSGNLISQVVRYRDDENFISCNFSASGTSITEKIDNQEKILNEMDAAQGISAGGEFTVETTVKGKQVSCFLNGEKKIEGQASERLSAGGIGFSFWDDLPEPSVFFVKKTEINSLLQ